MAWPALDALVRGRQPGDRLVFTSDGEWGEAAPPGRGGPVPLASEVQCLWNAPYVQLVRVPTLGCQLEVHRHLLSECVSLDSLVALDCPVDRCTLSDGLQSACRRVREDLVLWRLRFEPGGTWWNNLVDVVAALQQPPFVQVPTARRIVVQLDAVHRYPAERLGHAELVRIWNALLGGLDGSPSQPHLLLFLPVRGPTTALPRNLVNHLKGAGWSDDIETALTQLQPIQSATAERLTLATDYPVNEAEASQTVAWWLVGRLAAGGAADGPLQGSLEVYVPQSVRFDDGAAAACHLPPCVNGIARLVVVVMRTEAGDLATWVGTVLTTLRTVIRAADAPERRLRVVFEAHVLPRADADEVRSAEVVARGVGWTLEVLHRADAADPCHHWPFLRRLLPPCRPDPVTDHRRGGGER